MVKEILTKEKGKKLLLLGNEAIVRGALEAGVALATTYPGTPSSEIGDTFFKISKRAGMYFEYSVNEKVALEIAAGASHCGVRTMVSMKHVGLNVAADAFMTLIYTGTRGGMLIVSADDPRAHSSQNEQDNRFYAKMSGAPMLEPSTPAEAKEMTRLGFEISEELQVPILLRTTTRLNHTTGVVTTSQLKKPKTKGYFEKDPARFVMVPANARGRHKVLLEVIKKAKRMSESSQFNRIEGNESSEVGIITSGISYTYVKEAVKQLDLKNVKILKLGMTNPIPEKLVASFLKGLKTVIVVEELEPYLEEAVKNVAFDFGLSPTFFGKETGHFPRLYEYSLPLVRKAIADITGAEESTENEEVMSWKEVSDVAPPPRPPVLCPGCPHRVSYYIAKKVAGKGAVYSNDIGCYTLGVQPPLKTVDAILCMGASVGMGGGFAKASDQKVIAFIGDSTFFASGVPALINAVHNKHNFVLAILDNSTTAMTGHQPHPGIEVKENESRYAAKSMSIENLVKGCGVEFVRTVDPFDFGETEKAFKEALEFEGFAVIIAKSPCAILADREKRRAGIKIETYYIDQEVCRRCRLCISTFGCPAFYIVKTQEGKKDQVFINENLCDGCGACVNICPFDAIKRRDE